MATTTVSLIFFLQDIALVHLMLSSRSQGDERYFVLLSTTPRSVKILGAASSMASKLWQALQSCEILLPSLALCPPSWQRKQPGESVWRSEEHTSELQSPM